MSSKLKVSIVGTHGVPAKYGGFETLADFLCQELSEDLDLTVYCNSKKYKEKVKTYHGANLIYLNLDASGVQGIFYDVFTYIHGLFKSDVILYLSPVGSGFIIPIGKLFRTKVIVNHGGLNEWEREKLSWFQKKWAKFNHRIASKFSDVNVADNLLYRESLKLNFGSESIVIRYGGDHVRHLKKSEFIDKYPFVNDEYFISVSRAQIDNNLHIALEAFKRNSKHTLVLISNWNVSDYGVQLKEEYNNLSNIILLDAIYNKDELDYLRSNAVGYVHTHSRCGTAPSLVEAMCLGKAVISFDVPTNRETTHNEAIYYSNSKDLEKILDGLTKSQIEKLERQMKVLGLQNYQWSTISDEYHSIISKLAIASSKN